MHSAEGLTHLGMHFETERRSVLMLSSQLAGLAEALAQFALTKRDEFLGINPAASAGKPLPPCGGCRPTTPKAARSKPLTP